MSFRTGHGDHWSALTDIQKVDNIIQETQSTGLFLTPEVSTLNIDGVDKLYDLQPTIANNDDLTVKVYYRRNNDYIPIAAHPYIQCVAPARHLAHIPHANSSGTEGIVEELGGDIKPHGFFASDWLCHKELYESCRTGDKLSIAGLAYNCQIVSADQPFIPYTDTTYKKAKTFNELTPQDVFMRVDGTNYDEYYYLAYVVNCIEETYMDTPFYKLLVCIDNRTGTPDFWLYARKALLDRKPTTGEFITGTMWLQGTTKTNFQLITEKYVNNIKLITKKLKATNTLNANDLLKPLNHVQLLDGYTLDFATYDRSDRDGHQLGIKFYTRKVTDERSSINYYFEADRLPLVTTSCRPKSYSNTYSCQGDEMFKPDPIYGSPWELAEFAYECYLLELSEFIIYNLLSHNENEWCAYTDYASLHLLDLDLTRQRKPYNSCDYCSQAHVGYYLRNDDGQLHINAEFYYYDCDKGLLNRATSATYDQATGAITFRPGYYYSQTKLKTKSNKKK